MSFGSDVRSDQYASRQDRSRAPRDREVPADDEPQVSAARRSDLGGGEASDGGGGVSRGESELAPDRDLGEAGADVDLGELETVRSRRRREHSGNMLPGRERRRFLIERLLVRLVATCGVVGIGTALGAILVSSNVRGWITGLVVALVSVILSAILWSSRQV